MDFLLARKKIRPVFTETKLPVDRKNISDKLQKSTHSFSKQIISKVNKNTRFQLKAKKDQHATP